MNAVLQPFLKKRFALLLVIALVMTFAVGHSSLCSTVSAAACSAPAEKKSENISVEKIAPGYYKYSEKAVADAFKNQQKVVLYFWAPWCSSCTALDVEVEKNPDLIPSQVVVLRVPYDKSPELKKKYAVTIQHTFVQVDEAGNAVTQWVGGEPSDLKTKVK